MRRTTKLFKEEERSLIRTEFIDAKHKKRMMEKILPQLHACDPAVIREILEDGENLIERYLPGLAREEKPVKREKKKCRSQLALEAYCNGMPAGEAAAKYGVGVNAIYSYIYYHGLPDLRKKEKQEAQDEQQQKEA